MDEPTKETKRRKGRADMKVGQIGKRRVVKG